MPLATQPAALPSVRPFAPLNPAASHGFSPAGFHGSAAANSPGAAVAAIRPVMPSAAASGPDPIAEAPSAIWYVRPASGGQFGPAAGEVMRQWLAQRRVGGDSMLWREGWTDWKRAVAVFPSLGPAPAANAAPAPAQGSAPTSNFATDDDWVEAIIDTRPTVGHHSARSKGKQSNTIVIVSFFLILLCVLLAVVMATVIMRQGRDDQSSNGEQPAPTAIRLVDRSDVPLVRLITNA